MSTDKWRKKWAKGRRERENIQSIPQCKPWDWSRAHNTSCFPWKHQSKGGDDNEYNPNCVLFCSRQPSQLILHRALKHFQDYNNLQHTWHGNNWAIPVIAVPSRLQKTRKKTWRNVLETMKREIYGQHATQQDIITKFNTETQITGSKTEGYNNIGHKQSKMSKSDQMLVETTCRSSPRSSQHPLMDFSFLRQWSCWIYRHLRESIFHSPCSHLICSPCLHAPAD